VLSVSSGKGGVGKTTVVANLAVALAQMGRRVVVLDADLGLGNLDVLLGLVPRWTLEHVLSGAKTLSDIMLEGPAGIRIIPAGSGIPHLTRLTADQRLAVQDALEPLADSVDLLLIDTAAGISSNVTFFAAAAQEILVVISSDPTSLTDAYALIKILSTRHRERRFRILVNMARTAAEAAQVFRKLDVAVDRFLTVSVDYLGWVPVDDYVPLAVSQQRAVVDRYPQSPSSREFFRLAQAIGRWETAAIPKSTMQFFWQQALVPQVRVP
jgi:flagellar biosynthesis protein FlhG